MPDIANSPKGIRDKYITEQAKGQLCAYLNEIHVYTCIFG